MREANFPRWLALLGLASLTACSSGGPSDSLEPDPLAPPVQVDESGLGVQTIQLRSKSTANTGSGAATSLTIPKPTGIVASDLLIASLAIADSAAVITPPSGWTLVYRKDVTPTTGSTMSLTTYKKLATTSEPNGYVFSFSVSRPIQGAILDYSGAADVSNASGKVFASATTAPLAPAFNVAENDSEILVLFASNLAAPSYATFLPPSTFTELLDAHTTRTGANTRNMSLEAAGKGVASAGSYGPFTGTASTAGIAASQVLALSPACAPTTCAAEGKNCGSIADGCGSTLACGTCSTPATCGGGGVANVCGCTPTTCAAAGKNCGGIADGCGGSLACGSCKATETCSDNVCQSVARFYGDPGPGKVYVGAANDFGTLADLGNDLKPYNGNVKPFLAALRIYSGSPSSLTASNDINLPSGPRAEIVDAVSQGILPVVTSKWYAAGKASILAGDIDLTHIKPLADFFKSLAPAPVVYAPWHEMAEDFASGSDYTQVFRYIILKLRAYGVTNMAVGWVPTSSSINSGLAAGFYPGDDVVDIVGVDGYNFYTDLGYPGLSGPEFNNRWRDQRSIFQGTVDFAKAHAKPMGIFELGTPTATNLAHVVDRWKTTTDVNGHANLNTHAGKTLAQINAEWWTGPGGVQWLVDNGLVLLCYWSSGGNNAGFKKSWDNGTYSLTRRGSNKYAAPHAVTSEPNNPRAQGFVGVLNAPYAVRFPDVLGP